MKKRYLTFLVCSCTTLFSQVGIGTTSPTADLDVNGTFRVRTVNATVNESAAKDSIIVCDNRGILNRISAKKIVESHFKTFVKGTFTSSSDVSLTLSSGSKKIPFDNEEFDINNEFNTSTSTFTATGNGVYLINVNVKATPTLSLAATFGVSVLKNGIVVNRQSYTNVEVLGISATPPTRTVQTLVSLNAGDTISFNVTSDTASLNVALIGAKEDAYFTIAQVR